MKVVMIGTGYVGLVSGSCFAKIGAQVTCVDKVAAKIEALKAGQIPIYEPGLDAVVAEGVKAGRLTFTTDLKSAVAGADLVFIAVGTPSADDGSADLSYVFAAAAEIADALTGYAVVVTKSTVPVGTNRKVEKILRERRPGFAVDIASTPEFLREGAAISDFMEPDRIVVGTDTARARDQLRQLHTPLIRNEGQFVATTVETAELTKYAANAFLAVKISFINEIADYCEKVGADVEAVARGMGLDKRIGRWGLSTGPGYGGSCFPKDTRALAHMMRAGDSPTRIVETTIGVNEDRKKTLAARVAVALGGSVKGKTVALLGLTFKANTDDMRESPSLDLVPELRAAGAILRAYDPAGMDEAKKHAEMAGLIWTRDSYDAARDADVAVIVTEWNDFKTLDLARLKAALRGPVVVDFRNLHDPAAMKAAGLRYVSLGRAA